MYTVLATLAGTATYDMRVFELEEFSDDHRFLSAPGLILMTRREQSPRHYANALFYSA